MTIIIALIIFSINILSAYFWIWLYKELFKKQAGLKSIFIYGIIAAAESWGIVNFFALQGIVSKATIEELSKYSSSYVAKQLSPRPHIASDYISNALLCGVGFGIIENILYIYYSRGASIAGIGISRLLTNTVMHALFTGIIGYGTYLYVLNPKNSRLYLVILGIIMGIGLHVVYNRSLATSYLAISIIFIIGGYYLLAFLLYKADRLFIDNQVIDHVDGKV